MPGASRPQLAADFVPSPSPPFSPAAVLPGASQLAADLVPSPPQTFSPAAVLPGASQLAADISPPSSSQLLSPAAAPSPGTRQAPPSDSTHAVNPSATAELDRLKTRASRGTLSDYDTQLDTTEVKPGSEPCSFPVTDLSAPFLAHLAPLVAPSTIEPLVLTGSLVQKPRVSLRALLDSGAGLDAVSDAYAHAHRLIRHPLPQAAQARLPNAATLPLSHFVDLPVIFDGRFQFTVRAFCLPLHGIDVILGQPFLDSCDAVLHVRQRRVEFSYDGRRHSLSSRSFEPALRHGAAAGTAGASRRGRPDLPPSPPPSPPAALSPPSTPPGLRRARPPPPPDLLAVRTAALSHVEVLSAKQWRRAYRAKEIDHSDVLLFHLGVGPSGVALTGSSLATQVPLCAIDLSADAQRLAALDPTLPARLDAVLQKFEAQFKDFPDSLPPLDPDFLQKIQLTDDTPAAVRPYRLSPAQHEACRAQLHQLLAAGLIRPAASPYAAPVLMVPKPGQAGKWRMCVDYRALNNKLVRDNFPLPHPADVFNELAGHKFYSRLDLASGFWQIRLHEEDEAKTAFCAPSAGQFAWRVLPMGLKIAPSVFARMMQKVLKPFLGKFCVTYLDDIGVYSDTLDEHLEHIRLVLQALQDHHLFAKPSKCAFCLTELDFLGHVVSHNGVAVDPGKIDAIRAWPVPASARDLRSFLGLANYYRDHVENFSHRAGPLTDLLAAGRSFAWDDAADVAFKDLKTALTAAPVLQPFRADRPCTLVMSDASSHGLGAVLMQAGADGRLQPVAYHSRKLTPAERNYPTREQELLAVVDSLKAWRHYLLGTRFQLLTDHASLQYLNSQPHLSGRLFRWAQFLGEYDFAIAHVPGNRNTVADALSRRADFLPEAVCVPRPDLLEGLTDPVLAALSVVRRETRTTLIQAQRASALCSTLRARLLAHASSPQAPIHRAYRLEQLPPTDPAFTQGADNRVLYWVAGGAHRLVVPEDGALRRALLRDAHDSAIGAHQGVDKTYARLSAGYYWPRMFQDVRAFVTSCHTCLGNKPSNRAAAGLARPLPLPAQPWVQVGIDITGPLPRTSAGHVWLVVFVDHLSKQIHLVPLAGNDSSPLSATVLADAFFDTVVRQHGLPDAIVSDRGSQWLSSFWSALFHRCGTKLRFSTAHHPQTDGASERAIRTVGDAVRCCIDGLHDTWHNHLAAVELAYNSAVHASTGVSPFFLVYGVHPRLPLEDGGALPGPHHAPAFQFLDARISARRRAADALTRAMLRQAAQIDRHRRPLSLRVGDLVWLSTRHLNLATPNKFTPKYLGPFAVTTVMSSGNAVKLDLPPTIRVAQATFNLSQLREHVARPDALGPSAPAPPPPAFRDAGDDFWAIDTIIMHELRAGGLRYLVRWQGFGPQHDTWEPQSQLILDHGGRVAVALYRARRSAVDAHGSYAKRRAPHGRTAPLPPLSAADSQAVATSLTQWQLEHPDEAAQHGLPAPARGRRSAR